MDLNWFIDVPAAGVYTVEAIFRPTVSAGLQLDFTRDNEAVDGRDFVRSNVLTLNLRPAIDEPEIRSIIEAEALRRLERRSIPPDEVVTFLLQARQRNEWDRFLLYLDLESLLQRNDEMRRRYLRASGQVQQEMVDQFRESLVQLRFDGDIALVPTRFDVLKTTYTPDEASVLVEQRFTVDDLTEIKQYQYYLRRQDSSWIIYDYEVQNIGTE